MILRQWFVRYAMLVKRGSGYLYTDLERLRIEYWIYNSKMSVPEMAKMLGRSSNGVARYLERQGCLLKKIRSNETAWVGI